MVGPSGHCRPRDRSDQRSRRSRDRNGDLSVAGVDWLAPSEGGFVGGPRRQTIDLRADDAVQKLTRALGQLERPEDEARRREHDVDRASREQRSRLGRNRISNPAFVDAQRRSVNAFRRLLAHVRDKKRAVRLFNEFDSVGASEHRPENRQARGDVVDPSRRAGAERGPDGHERSLRGLHRTIEIVPPIKQFIGFIAFVFVAFVLAAFVLVGLLLVALVLEAKHDLRMNTPAVVEFDRD